ncbi:hypothetical protein OUZ56_004443 [Daphnia magna]|uniref:Uncharacterized protein n=1 Tax=Daphnia magna TaxID=35525 RepID=A0ABQ9YPV0_9CRUS|nr:hypothetical protein OUZ56_004443 [Daphnia magna]
MAGKWLDEQTERLPWRLGSAEIDFGPQPPARSDERDNNNWIRPNCSQITWQSERTDRLAPYHQEKRKTTDGQCVKMNAFVMDRMRLGVRAGSHNNNKKRNKKIGGAQG